MKRTVSGLAVFAMACGMASAASIRDGAYEPITRSSSPRTFGQWGSSWVSRINAAAKKAVELTADLPDCDEVVVGGLSFERSKPKSEIVVFTDCKNGSRFYFTEEQTKSGAKPASLQSGLAGIKDSEAATMCEAAAKPKVRFASTMKVSVFGTNVQRGTHGISVALPFEAKNSFGAMLPYVAHCSVSESGASLISIKER